MKLILAEKPSVARDIARAIGNPEPQKGCIKAGDYYITWALGHLLEISDDNVPKEWKEESLPILPEKFSYRPRDKNSAEQLKVIKELLSKVSEVIIATDAGREGQLIAELILRHAGWKGATKRLWTSEALTREVVLRELKSGLRDNKDFESLYACALARQHSDWIVGINLTRMATIRAGGKELWSVGRVQTPTLALVVERDKEIENFKPVPYGVVKAIFSKGGQTYEATLLPSKDLARDRAEGDTSDDEAGEEDRVFRLRTEEASGIVEKLKSLREGKVKQVKKELKKELPPLLHSLTSLQREANKTYGFSASKTLNLAQSLYEKGYLSYPRSDAQHLAESTKPLVIKVLKALQREDLIPAVDRAGKRVFDDSKLTDHHAIIPLKAGNDLAGDEKKVYDLVLRKFLGAFMPPYEYELTRIFTELGGYMFFTQGRRDISPGWKSLYGEDKKEQSLPEVKEGDSVLKEKLWAEKRETKPPPHYTEATLLKVMEKLSLGTPATRASIIDTLKEREYIKLQGKSLISTPKGKELIEKLQGSQVVSPEMTGRWEEELESIYRQRKGWSGYRSFLERIKNWTLEEVKAMKGKTFEKKHDFVGSCPLCGGQVIELPKSYQCQSCKASVWKENFGRRLNAKQALTLMGGKELVMHGLKSREGKEFSARLVWQEGKVRIAGFMDRPGGDKPKGKHKRG